MSLPSALQDAAAAPVDLKVYELLALFGERNRDFEIVGRIQQMLADHELVCSPSLSDGALSRNSVITIHRASTAYEEPSADAGASASPQGAESGQADAAGPTALRICDVPTADLEGDLVTAHPDEDLIDVRTRMMLGNFSQLPVLSSPHVLTGVVSWKSIAMAHTRGPVRSLADTIQKADIPEVKIDADLLATIPDIFARDYVFVRGHDYTVCGIVTAADLSNAFGDLAGPYLRLGEVERRLRHCVSKMCDGTVKDLRDATGYRKAESAHDLTLGQIEQVFRKPDRWSKLRWGIRRDTFVDELAKVRKIRNEVAHFRPNPLTNEQRDQLSTFAGWLKELVP